MAVSALLLRRVRPRIGPSVALALVLSLIACGGGGTSDKSTPDGGAPAPTISGTVTAPGGQGATSAAAWLRRAGEVLGVVTPAALTVLPPAAGLPVALVALDDLGVFVSTVATATTDANGFYSMARPATFTPGLRYVVVAGGAANGLHAFATGTTVDVNPFTHVAWALVVQEIRASPGAALSDIPVAQVVGLVETVRDLAPSVDLSATTAAVVAALEAAVQTAEDTGGLLSNLLEPGGFEGTVTGPDGAALAGVQVKVFRYPEWTLEARLRTDASGRYTAHLQAGSYIVAAVNDLATSGAASEWWTAGGGAALQNAAEPATVADTLVRRDFALQAGGRVSGTVTAEASGAPLPGVRVVLRQFDLGLAAIPVRTDADGRFTVNARPGAYYVEILNDTLQPYASEVYSAEPPHPNGANSRLDAQKLTVAVGSSATASASLLAGQRLFGAVFDPVSATSVEGVVVRIIDQATGSGSFYRVTDRNGTFAVWLRPQAYTIRARGQTANVDLGSGARRVDFAAPVGTITATLRHPGGAPAPGVFGYVHDAANLANGLFAWEGSRADGSLSLFVPATVTSVVVQFRSDELPGASVIHPGQTRLFAGQRLRAPGAGNTLALGTITLPAGGLLTGTVRKSGVAKSSNWVTIRSGGTGWADVFLTIGTLSDGSYSVVLPAGTYARVCTLEPPGTTICDGAQPTGATWAYRDAVGITAGGTTTVDLSYPGHSIAGAVSGAVTSGVTLTLSGGASRTTTSGNGGAYVFANLANGSYTVTPSLAGYTFSPASRSVTVSGGSVAAQDFTATAVTHVISGVVSGAATSGVTVTLSGAASAVTTTGAGGAYTFAGLADGSYTVTASLAGYAFTPPSQAVTLAGADVAGRNFTATVVNPHAISGTISGAAGTGVTVRLSGAASAVTTTDGAGAYAFPGLADGSYTVTPWLPGFTFTPASRSVTLSGADAAGQDFTAPVPPAPGPPAAIAVRPANGGAVVTWTPSPGATSYAVHSATSATLTGATVTAAAGPSVAIGALPNGVRQWFAVRAVGPGGQSALSPPRCAVPTAADTTGLELWDPLCGDALAGRRWLNPGGYGVRVSGGAAELTAVADDLEPRALRNGNFTAGVTVNAGPGNRVTTLSALLTVPAASAARTGGAVLRTAVRLLYEPPEARTAQPWNVKDNLVLEVGLMETGSGLYAYRYAIHCDTATCGDATASGLAFADPAGLGSVPGTTGFAGVPAAYDTAYRVTARLDEVTGVFHWTIDGGTLTTPSSGTVDPSQYLQATPGWSGVPIAGSGFWLAQLFARVQDSSPQGGGSGAVTARFDDVQVALNDASTPTPFDDFDGTGGNSGPEELSLARWNLSGRSSALPSGGALALHGQATSVGYATGVAAAAAISDPEPYDLMQVDLAIPAYATTSTGSAVATVSGRLFSDGTAGATGDATGDIGASLNFNAAGGASYSIWRCSNPSCSATSALGGGSDPTITAGTGVHAVRLSYDRAASRFVFGMDATVLNVPAPAGATYGGPAHAPRKQVSAGANVAPQAGARTSIDVRVNNVFVRPDLSQPLGGSCSALDPSAAAPVSVRAVASAPPPATGGPLVDGTYHLTAMNIFTGAGGTAGPTGFTARQVFVLSGVAFDYAGIVSSGREKHSGTFGIAGTRLVVVEHCPAVNGAKIFEYSAQGTELRLYDLTPEGVPTEMVLQRQ